MLFLFTTEFSNHVIEKMLLKPCKFYVFNEDPQERVFKLVRPYFM